MRVAIVGGGLCGLTAAIRLAQRDVDVELFEAAPSLGGRTRSFLDPHAQQWVDNGPHLLCGAYHATRTLLTEAGADANVSWQSSLTLPLWDGQRGHFLLRPHRFLPFGLALSLACLRLPGHGWADLPALLRLARDLGHPPSGTEGSVRNWLDTVRMPTPLIRDLMQPLCLGAMNEPLEDANAASFRRVLRDAFADHQNARLGWFRMPLSEGLIRPLSDMAAGLGVRIHCACRIRKLLPCKAGIELASKHGNERFDAGILALPLRAGQKLLAVPETAGTRSISNIHMWFRDLAALSHPFIGGIGTTGQWFFDVTRQMDRSPFSFPSGKGGNEQGLRHICAVISADEGHLHGHALQQRVCDELAQLTGNGYLHPQHVRIVSERHATTGIVDASQTPLIPDIPGLIDACEAPSPGDLPSTIELAVRRGNQAAEQCYSRLFG